MMSSKKPLFKPGDYVVAVNDSFGWGSVRPNMIGKVISVEQHPPVVLPGPIYEVKFAVQSRWTCAERDLRLASKPEIAKWMPGLIAATKTPAFTTTPPVNPPSISDLFKQLGQPMGNMGISYTDFAASNMSVPIDKPKRHRLPSHLKGLKVGGSVRVIRPDPEDNEEFFNVGDIFVVKDINYTEKVVRGYGHSHNGSYWISFVSVTTDLEGGPGKVTLDSVILADEKKQKILATIKQVDNHGLIFEQWGFDSVLEKGKAISMLFYGPPGTGKTLAAQAISDHLNKKLKIIGSAEIESSEPGQAERNIKAFFEGTKDDTVLLFDECDSLVYSREHVGSILAAQVNQLLSSLENFEGIVVFTTNRLGVLDEAFNRRLSLKVEFGMPNRDERMKIWQRMIPEKAPLAEDVDWLRLAEVEITGGYIKNVVLRAARMAAAEDMKDKDKKITMKHLVDALTDEVESVIEFEEARKTNHTPRQMGGGLSRGVGHSRGMGAGK